jgi:hypothetical protein
MSDVLCISAAVITDIVANLNPLPIAGAVAISGPPGFNGDILPKIATPALLSILSQFYTNDNVTLALDIRTQSPETLFKDPNNIPFSLKAEYLGQTVFQSPELSALVSTRPQDPTKLFAVGEAGGLKMQLISGTSDGMSISSFRTRYELIGHTNSPDYRPRCSRCFQASLWQKFGGQLLTRRPCDFRG